MGYTHLSQSERYQIQRQYKAGLSRRQIAEGMGRDTTTISREPKRGQNQNGVRFTFRTRVDTERRTRVVQSIIPHIHHHQPMRAVVALLRPCQRSHRLTPRHPRLVVEQHFTTRFTYRRSTIHQP